MSITIQPVNGMEQAWDGYVMNHPRGALYQLLAWRNAVRRSFKIPGQYFVALEGDRIRGILPFFFVKTFSGTKAVSLPYGGNYAGLLADTPEIESQLLQFGIESSRTAGADCLELRCIHEHAYGLPMQDLYVTYIRELAEDDEKILADIPRKSRASIRNGYKKFNLQARYSRDYALLHRLYAMNKRRLGSPVYPKSFYRDLLEEYGEDAGILSIEYQERQISAVIFFRFRDTMCPTFSGADNRYNFTNMNNVMYYELMKKARSEGLKYFDFGRSREEASAGRFKKNMGFDAQPLYFYFCMHNGAEIPNLSPSNKKFALAMAIWRRLPLFVTKVVGPRLMRYFP